MARGSSDDFIYGICREPECHYVWLREPTEPVTCPSCGTPGWPMTPAEAEARMRQAATPTAIEGTSCHKPHCPGHYRRCAYCTRKNRDNGVPKIAFECDRCSAHVEIERKRPTVVNMAKPDPGSLADQLSQPVDDWIQDQRRDEHLQELDRAQRAMEERGQ